MTDLIVCVSSGKGTWGHVSRLIEGEEWTKIFILTNDFGQEKFTKPENGEFILINERQGLQELVEEIVNNLKGKTAHEVAVNLVSGSGKEHMAIFSALIKLGLAFRLVALTKDGVKEI